MEKYLEEALYDKMMADRARVEKVKEFIEESWKDWLEDGKDVHAAFREYGEIADILMHIEAIIDRDFRDNEELDMKHENKQMPVWESKKIKDDYCHRLERRVSEIHELREEAREVLHGMCNRIGGDKWWETYTNFI